jgi:hypothetical protein
VKNIDILLHSEIYINHLKPSGNYVPGALTISNSEFCMHRGLCGEINFRHTEKMEADVPLKSESTISPHGVKNTDDQERYVLPCDVVDLTYIFSQYFYVIAVIKEP